MNRGLGFRALLAGAAHLPVAAGCNALLAPSTSQPDVATVLLVHRGAFEEAVMSSVDAAVFFGDQADMSKEELIATGEVVQFQVSEEEPASFARDCEELQALVVTGVLRLPTEEGPESESDVLRAGQDFTCGDTITFTFEHSEVVLDFGIAVDVSP